MDKINNIFRKRFPKIALFIILDILVLILTSILALWMRFDFGHIPQAYVKVLYYLPIDIFIMIGIFTVLKLYTSVWSYASVIELLNVISSCIITEVLIFLYKSAFYLTLPRSYYLIHIPLFIIFVGGIRFSYRIARAIYSAFENRFKKKHTMLIGAGGAGRILIDEILRNQKLFDTKIVCIIDDNKDLKHGYIRGIPVCGTREKIKEMANKYHVDDIVIAIPSAPKEEIAKIVSECQKTSCSIKILPSIYASMNENQISFKDSIRPLSYEDFLGRDEIVVDTEEISGTLKDKVVLVTGGGGSIGSELCRQIAKCNPKKLIVFDIYENNAYEIQQELLRTYPKLDLHTIIGSVRDYERLKKVFNDLRPNIVFHAAAHKHVPLMEVSPNEAIKNNCLGTLNACKLADEFKCEKFVLISTDKAVRPTNVMGASKRICEMIMQTYDKMSKNTDYVAVRFGNVLGSNGSVIPLFLKQIDAGGPVTVTHKDMRRFFMTIPEAVSLVLQASVYANGGEIFVLDMGEPVLIYDLAKKLIRYKGFEPDKDING